MKDAHLVEGAGVNVDGVAVGAGAGGQRFVVLGGLLHVLGVVLLDVVVRANGPLQVVVDDAARTLRTGPAGEQHHAGPRVRVRALQDKTINKRKEQQLNFSLLTSSG